MVRAIASASLGVKIASGTSYERERGKMVTGTVLPIQHEHQQSDENIDVYGNPQTDLDIAVVSTSVTLFFMFYLCLSSKANYCN